MNETQISSCHSGKEAEEFGCGNRWQGRRWLPYPKVALGSKLMAV